MSVECPAPGCSYSGHLDAVEGHLGGVADALHEGVVVPDIRKSLHGEASEGVSEGLVLVGIVAVVLLVVVVGSEPTQQRENEPVEGPEAEVFSNA